MVASSVIRDGHNNVCIQSNGHRSVDGRAGDFSLAAAPYKFVGGTLTSAE